MKTEKKNWEVPRLLSLNNRLTEAGTHPATPSVEGSHTRGSDFYGPLES